MVEGRTVEVGWWGPSHSTRPTLVLLHEGLGSVKMWRDVPDLLAEQTLCPVMAYSRWGHGFSDAPAAPQTVEFMHEHARLLAAILDATGINRPVILGHSDGASIALIFAANHPARPRGLVLEAPHVFVEALSVSSVERTKQLYATTNLRERLGKYHDDVDVAFRGWSDVWLHPDFQDWNLEALLPSVTCPVLLIQGEQDEYGTLAQIDAIERQVSGPVERLVLAECGHSPHRDQRDAVVGAVGDFVTRWS